VIPPIDIFTIVLAHGGAREIFLRHLPLWRATSGMVWAITPTDDKLVVDDVIEVSGGLSEHHGQHHIGRVRLALETMAMSSWPIFVLHEYDSLLLETSDGIRPPTSGISGNVRTNSHRDKYQGNYYINFPWIMDHAGVTALKRGLDNSPPGTEHDRCDRLLGYICERDRIPVKDLRSLTLGYSRNTLDVGDLNGLRPNRRMTTVAWHGVKTPKVLREIQRGFSRRSDYRTESEAGGRT
jgi:hypothetical protein